MSIYLKPSALSASSAVKKTMKGDKTAGIAEICREI